MNSLFQILTHSLSILLTVFMFLPAVSQADERHLSGTQAESGSNANMEPVYHLLGSTSVSGVNPFDSSVFYSGFESGEIDADVGREFAATSFSDFLVLANPAPSAVNPTTKVLKAQSTNTGNIRAEYHAQRMETDEKTYIYAWKEYVPSNFFADKNIRWVSLGQWKTWPCEDGSKNDKYKIYSELICTAAGIFNHRLVFEDPLQQEFMFRAKPNCESYYHDLGLGAWHAYVLEIYWTNTNQGFYNIYVDGVLVKARSQLKTLFDQFPGDGSCNMFWGMGIYGSWTDEGAGILEYYLDDIAVFDVADGVSVEQVLAWQGF